MICKNCGTKNSKNAGKCIKCGAPLSSGRGTKESVFEFSIYSGLMLAFSVIALVFLFLPGFRSISTITEISLPQSTDEIDLDLIYEKQSIENERWKISTNLNNLSGMDIYYKSKWNSEEAISVLETAKATKSESEAVEIEGRISKIKELTELVNEQQEKVNAKSAEVAPVQEEIQKRSSRISEIKPVLDERTSESYKNYLESQIEAKQKRLESLQESQKSLNDKIDTLSKKERTDEEEVTLQESQDKLSETVAEITEIENMLPRLNSQLEKTNAYIKAYVDVLLNDLDQEKALMELSGSDQIDTSVIDEMIRLAREEPDQVSILVAESLPIIDVLVIEEFQKEYDILSAEVAELKKSIEVPLKELSELQAELERRIVPMEEYNQESIDSLPDDDVNRGAFYGIAREHNTLKGTLDTILLIVCILLIASFAITIFSWASKYYILRLITMISNILLVAVGFFLPLAVYTWEVKWPFEIARCFNYGLNFNFAFLITFICSIATLIVGMAFVTSEATKSSK